ncbi:ABC transporter ATP-binding protein [Aquihabitans daechungensis]|uniref:ABC transporter ATP-binding protein n=1 Tax=Aquihabitans daechungensis TaxID=1052257 RepID=UPI003B9F0328
MTEAGRGVIEARGLTVAWPGPSGSVPALDALDLDIDPGSFVSVVGPSGCGKSTVLRILAGLLVPDAGTAQVDGAEVVGRPGATAWLPQRDALLPWRRVLGNAVLGAEIHGIPTERAKQRARLLLDEFGLAGTEDLWPSELSGGMRQRVAVLRTFLTPAPVLLLDEPFGALDALTRRQMQGWLQGVLLAAREEDDARTVVLVTHDVEEALLLSDRVLVMSPKPGRIVADVPVGFERPRPADLVADPAFVRQRADLLAVLGA